MTGSANNVYEQLATRIYAGDRAAEEEFFKLFHRPLHTMLQTRSGDPHLAEDLVQDAFHILLTRLRDKPLDNPSALGNFLHQTALNLWIGHLRKEDRRKTYTNSNTEQLTEEAGSSQIQMLERAREASAIRQLLNELQNDRDREILHRTFVLDEDKKTVCEALNLTAQNFDRVIYRAKKRFRKLVESNMDYTP